MSARHHYTDRELRYAVLQDMITDLRCARRDGLQDYAWALEVKVRVAWRLRHTARIDQYGWPEGFLA